MRSCQFFLPWCEIFKSQIMFVGILSASILINGIGNVFWYRINKEIKTFAFLFSLGILPTFYTLTVALFQILAKAIFYSKKCWLIQKQRKMSPDKQNKKRQAYFKDCLKESILYPFFGCNNDVNYNRQRRDSSTYDINDDIDEEEESTEEIELKGIEGASRSNVTAGSSSSSSSFQSRSIFSKTQRKPRIVYRHYFIMALCDTFLNIFALVPVLYFSPIFVIVFHQLSLPLNIIFSRLILKRKYNFGQILSIILMLSAVIIASQSTFHQEEVPSSSVNNSSYSSNSTVANDETMSLLNNTELESESEPEDAPAPLDDGISSMLKTIIMIFYFLCMKIISGLITIYREHVYQYYDLDIIEANMMISLNQFPISWFALFIFFIPFPNFVPFPHFHAYSDLITYIFDGFRLFFSISLGETGGGEVNNPNITRTDGGKLPSHLSMSFSVVLGLYVLFLVLNNTLDTAILKTLNSTFIVIMQVVVFVSTIVFLNFKIFAGDAQIDLTFSEFFAVGLAITSTLIYWYYSKKQEEQEARNNALVQKAFANVTVEKKSIKAPKTLLSSDMTSTLEMSHRAAPALVEILTNLIKFEKYDDLTLYSSDDNTEEEEEEKSKKGKKNLTNLQRKISREIISTDPNLQESKEKTRLFEQTFSASENTNDESQKENDNLVMFNNKPSYRKIIELTPITDKEKDGNE